MSVVSPAPPTTRAWAWRPVLQSWVAARVVVLIALVVAESLPARHHEGLLGWDADWYRRIADHGYRGIPEEGVRFFPLLPLVARALALGHDAGWALLLLANAGAVAAGLLTHRLALREGLSESAATRAVWALALAPAGYVLVMGYTEPLFFALLAGLFIALRDRRWLLVAVLGLVAGALRPTGFLLGLPVLIEALRGVRSAPLCDLGRRALAVVAPAVGLVAYLAWVGATYGKPLLPFTVQSTKGLRGGTFVDPLPAVWRALTDPTGPQGPGALLHVPGVIATLVLLVVVVRRLPLSHTAYVLVTLALGLTVKELQSADRYELSALPLLLAAGLVLSTGRRVVAALVVTVPLLFASAVLAFVHQTVP